MVRERLNYSKREALAYIEKVDEQRRRWTSFLYGVDWGDPLLYDLVIHLEHMSLETACDIISATVRERCFELTPGCRRALEGLALASKVKATLAIAPPTEGLELEATADNGVVKLKGRLARADQLSEVREIAMGVAGVIDLDLDRLSPPEGV